MGMQIGGITLSTSLVTLYNAVGLGILMSKKIKLDYKDLFINLTKMIFIGAIALVFSFISARVVDILLVRKINLQIFEIIKICVVSIILSISYVCMSLMFKIGYVDDVKERILSKFKK